MKTVPNIIGACGTIQERFEKLICEKLDKKINTNEIQHFALLGTAIISTHFFSTNFQKQQTNPAPQSFFKLPQEFVKKNSK